MTVVSIDAPQSALADYGNCSDYHYNPATVKCQGIFFQFVFACVERAREKRRFFPRVERFLKYPLDNFRAVCYNTVRQCGIAKR